MFIGEMIFIYNKASPFHYIRFLMSVTLRRRKEVVVYYSLTGNHMSIQKNKKITTVQV